MATYVSARMIERLLIVLAELGIDKASDLKARAGIKYNTAYQIFTKRAESMDCQTLASIMKKLPGINANYVLIGTGKPLLDVTLTDDVPTVYLPAGGGLVNLKFGEE
jgi:predicted transcriptional regulator